MLFSTVLLYLSTSVYMGALIWAWSSGNRLISGATDGLFSPTYDGRDIAAFIHSIHQQSWMMTITLAVNVGTWLTFLDINGVLISIYSLQILIGDAVVWWRASVIWQHKIVNCIGLLLLTFTLGMSPPSLFASSLSPYLIPPTFAASSGCPSRGASNPPNLSS